MPTAVLYRWKVRSGCEARFTRAWAQGTEQIHDACESMGARLHRSGDGTFWSYALWRSDDQRARCFDDHDWMSRPCFVEMQQCIDERFDEIVMEVSEDQLAALPAPKSLPTLNTERLVLRPLHQDDAEALLPAFTSEMNLRYWSSGPLADVRELHQYLHWNVHAEETACFAITRGDDVAQGWVTLIDQGRRTAEIGFILRPDAQGQGLAAEAARAVLEYAFDVRGLRRVFADVDPDNAPSIALIEALGLRYEGRLRGAWETHIGVRDSLIYGMLATDRD